MSELVRTTLVTEIIFPPYDEGPGWKNLLDDKHIYVALIDGRYYCGRMSSVWFGWNFIAPGYINGIGQVDHPENNGCHWQKVWRVDHANGLQTAEAFLICAGIDPVQVAFEDEMRYANARRRWCIDHGMVTRQNGPKRKITEESPIEAYLYKPTKPFMPPVPDYVEEDED